MTLAVPRRMTLAVPRRLTAFRTLMLAFRTGLW